MSKLKLISALVIWLGSIVGAVFGYEYLIRDEIRITPVIEARMMNINQSISKNRCIKTKEEMAAVIGGNQDEWKEPEYEGGAWIFETEKENWTKLSVPSWGGVIEYWNGETNSSTATKSGTVWVDKASFRCN